jgi:hypothetical protein
VLPVIIVCLTWVANTKLPDRSSRMQMHLTALPEVNSTVSFYCQFEPHHHRRHLLQSNRWATFSRRTAFIRWRRKSISINPVWIACASGIPELLSRMAVPAFACRPFSLSLTVTATGAGSNRLVEQKSHERSLRLQFSRPLICQSHRHLEMLAALRIKARRKSYPCTKPMLKENGKSPLHNGNSGLDARHSLSQ